MANEISIPVQDEEGREQTTIQSEMIECLALTPFQMKIKEQLVVTLSQLPHGKAIDLLVNFLAAAKQCLNIRSLPQIETQELERLEEPESKRPKSSKTNVNKATVLQENLKTIPKKYSKEIVLPTINRLNNVINILTPKIS